MSDRYYALAICANVYLAAGLIKHDAPLWVFALFGGLFVLMAALDKSPAPPTGAQE
jgi:hypothetical protein